MNQELEIKRAHFSHSDIKDHTIGKSGLIERKNRN